MQHGLEVVRSFGVSGMDAEKGVFVMRFLILAAAAAAVAVPATAANAQYGRGYGYGHGYNQRDVRQEQRECRRELRRADSRREYRRELRECQREIAMARRGYRGWDDDRRGYGNRYGNSYRRYWDGYRWRNSW